MIRSLRLRFFLIIWPLIVLTVAGVAFAFDRWTVVTIEEQRVLPRPDAPGAVADSVVLDTAGAIVVTSDSTIRVTGPARGNVVEFERRVTAEGAVALQVAELSGREVRDSSGTVIGRKFRFPRDSLSALRSPASMRAKARRTIWIAVGVSSAVAALLALALSGPLAGQIERLGRAAARVRGGDFAARVDVRGSDELGKLEAAFNEMSASLGRAEQHKRNLAHDVAHELRTPLTNIVGMIEAMQDGLRQPDAATLATLRSEVGLLTELVSDLQELSLAESGQLTFDITEVDVVAEAAAAVDAMRESAAGLGLSLSALPSPLSGLRSPLFAVADRRRLAQVLRNLLRNAITHTPPGGTVLVDSRLATHDPRQVVITVTDTGAGIPPEHLDLIWERFHRVDPSRDRAGGGHGLGLAIVKQFVEGMGGSVSVSSTVGQGSRFEIRLKKASA